MAGNRKRPGDYQNRVLQEQEDSLFERFGHDVNRIMYGVRYPGVLFQVIFLFIIFLFLLFFSFILFDLGFILFLGLSMLLDSEPCHNIEQCPPRQTLHVSCLVHRARNSI